MLMDIALSLGSPGFNCNNTRIRSLSGHDACEKHDRIVAAVSGSLSYSMMTYSYS